MGCSLLKRAALWIPAVLVASGVVVLGPAGPAAHAATVTMPVTYSCTTTAYGGVEYTNTDEVLNVTLTAPAAATNGDTVSLDWSVDQLPSMPPIEVTNVSTTTTVALTASRPGHADDSVSQTTAASTPAADVLPNAAMPGSTSATLLYRALVDTSGDAVVVTPGDLTVTVVAADDGFDGAVTVCDPVDVPPVTLASITVNGDPPACVADDSCDGAQTFVGTVTPNTLSADAQPDPSWPTSYDVGPFVSSTTAQTASVDVKFARVTDTRPGNYGWSLTASFGGSVTDGEGNTVSDVQMSVSDLACDETPGASGSSVGLPGSGGDLSSPDVLCSTDQGELGDTGGHGGQWDVTGRLTVTVPAFARAGLYGATVVLTLS